MIRREEKWSRDFELASQETQNKGARPLVTGLNALTLLVIQCELARKHGERWESIQRQRADAGFELEHRERRIRQLIGALELSVESNRDRLHRTEEDPWFSLLNATVACIISDQPEHVAHLYEEAKHNAPPNAEQSMRRALKVYDDLGIQGRGTEVFGSTAPVGTIGVNVKQALALLKEPEDARQPSKGLKRILMFVGLRVDSDAGSGAASDRWPGNGNALPWRGGFPAEAEAQVREAIGRAIDEEIDAKNSQGRIMFGMAGGGNGGDILFHELCREKGLPTRLCLPLSKPRHIGQYVAPAGKHWVERFNSIYRDLHVRQDDTDFPPWAKADFVRVFSDTMELPRWLQGKPHYNIGRRNNLWMLQYAIVAATHYGDISEITLLAFWDGKKDGGLGGIGSMVDIASMAGIKVHPILIPEFKPQLS